VVYIRFDALYNYLTCCLHPQDFTNNLQSVSGENNDMCFWNDAEVIHTIGKDISRFHAIYRPAMLMSSEHKIPNTEIINGFFTVDGQKMSKSLGNKIDPLELLEEHGRDALVYYLFSDIKIGSDGDFSRERFEVAKENVLKKGW
jgi:methionyl-tRNA synthetase